MQSHTTEQTNLNVISLFKGSFGIRLASASEAKQLDFLEEPLLEKAVDDFVELLNGSKNEQTLRDLMEKFRQRAASRYRRFLIALTDSEANFRVEWGSSNPEKGGTATLSYSEAWRAIEICEEIETTEPQEREITGELIAVNSEQKTFRMRDKHDRTIYFGKISDAVFDSGVDLVVVKPPKTYKARIQQTIEEKSTGESVFKNKLLHLEFVSTPQSKRTISRSRYGRLENSQFLNGTNLG
jgi:hypothetical protein